MEVYVYYSIIIFSTFVVLLYSYLLYQKVLDIFHFKKKSQYKKEIEPYINNLFVSLDEGYIPRRDVKKMSRLIKNRIKRGIIIDLLTYYSETFSGELRSNITRICEETNLVSYEIKKLKAKDHFIIALACKHIGEFRSIFAVKELLYLLENKSIDVIYHALMALAKIGDLESFVEAFNRIENKLVLSERSFTEIIDSFEGDKVDLYRRMIEHNNIEISTIFIKSAGNYMDTQLNKYIFDFINDSNKDRRIAVVKAFGQNGDVCYTDALIEKLKDTEWEVRAAAAKSLGRIANFKALDSLVESLTDSQWWVRYNAAQAIINMPKGIEKITEVLQGGDKFAKDILLSAIEDSGIINDIFIYEFSEDESRRNLAVVLKKHMNYELV